MILPATFSTVNALFTGRERGIAFAIWGSTIGGMAADGPVVGGWLTTSFTWRWAFLINIPIVLIVLIGTLLWVPETKDAHAERGVDIAGVVLLGALTLTAFVLVQRARARAHKPALLDLSLLRIRSFRYGSIAALIMALGEFGMLFSLPLFLQGALGYSALDTGLLILALAIGTFLISGGTPQLTRRLGGRAVVRIGLFLETVAITGLGLSISLTANGGALAAWLFLYGAGVGMATAQLTSVILFDVPVHQSGQASGLQSTVRQFGLCSRHRPARHAAHRDPGRLDRRQPRCGGQAVQAAAEAAMVTGARITTLSAAAVILLGLLATIAMSAMRREDEDSSHP